LVCSKRNDIAIETSNEENQNLYQYEVEREALEAQNRDLKEKVTSLKETVKKLTEKIDGKNC